MLAVVALPGQGEKLSVMADIHVEDAHAERERIDHLGILKIPVIADDGLRTTVGKQAVQAVGGVVVDDVVDALEFHPLDHLPLLKVIHHQTAHLGIVERKDETLRVPVQGDESRIVQLDAIQVRHLPLPAGIQVELGDMGEVAGGVHGRIGLAGPRIIDERRHGTQRIPGQGDGLRDRILPDRGEVGFLVFLFLDLPLVPDLPERAAEHLLELFAEEGLAVGRAVVETDDVLIAVLPHHIVHEAGAVEVGVGTHLEVHGGTFRLQTHDGEKRLSPVDDAAEVHLVIAAQSTADAAAQPGLHEAGDAFVVPAGSIPARDAQVTP